jgi:hypothetical protein
MRKSLLCAVLAAMTLGASATVASAQTPLKTVLFKNGFASPLFVAAPPNDFDHLYVVERAGRIKVCDINNGNVLGTFLDISGLTTTVGERGLLSMVFHPQYNGTTNKDFFVYYTNSGGNIVIAKYRAINPLVANTAGTILLTINHPTFSNHNGGQVAFGGDGMLYFACGDGGSANDPNNNAQNVNTLLGKVNRINVTNTGAAPYTIPADNPLAGATPGLDEIWSIGVRNPFRFTFDRNTGDLYIADVGQNAWEEVDFQPGGEVPALGTPRNYGWRCLEATHATNLTGCSYPNPYPNLFAPIHEYGHGVGNCIIGGNVYRGAAVPDLRGTYFFADNGSSKIWSLKYQGVQFPPVTDRTTELAPGGGLSITQIAGFGEDAYGEVYICDLGGEVFKIVPTSPVLVGVSTYGSGTPGCSGSEVMGVNHSPVVNSPGFRLTTTNCPASALGLGLVTDVQDFAGSDPFGLGVTFHVGFIGATQLISFDAFSDPSGNAQTPAAIPNDNSLIGMNFYAQTIWAWPTTTCVLNPVTNPLNLSSSNGLKITIQP